MGTIPNQIALVKGFYAMIRRLLFGIALRAAQNPKVRAEAGKLAGKAAEKAKPALLKGARRAGEITKAASDEIAHQVAKTKKPKGKG